MQHASQAQPPAAGAQVAPPAAPPSVLPPAPLAEAPNLAAPPPATTLSRRVETTPPTAAPPRTDPRAAIRDVPDSLSCSHVQLAEEGGAFRLTGFVPRGADRNLVAALQQRGVERALLRLDLRSFDAPFCEILDTLRPFQDDDAGGVQVGLVGRPPLTKGSLLRLDAGLPDWGTHLSVDYVMSSGQVAHLVRLDGQRPGTRFRLGEPSGSFTGWEVDEPFGTDMVVAIASDGPLHATPRPEVESLDEFMAALSGALRAAQEGGRRVSARVLLIDTAPR